MAEAQLLIDKDQNGIILLTVTNNHGGIDFAQYINEEAFEILKKGLHAEHEIDITRAILESAFPAFDDTEEEDGKF